MTKLYGYDRNDDGPTYIIVLYLTRGIHIDLYICNTPEITALVIECSTTGHVIDTTFPHLCVMTSSLTFMISNQPL